MRRDNPLHAVVLRAKMLDRRSSSFVSFAIEVEKVDGVVFYFIFLEMRRYGSGTGIAPGWFSAGFFLVLDISILAVLGFQRSRLGFICVIYVSFLGRI